MSMTITDGQVGLCLDATLDSGPLTSPSRKRHHKDTENPNKGSSPKMMKFRTEDDDQEDSVSSATTGHLTQLSKTLSNGWINQEDTMGSDCSKVPSLEEGHTVNNDKDAEARTNDDTTNHTQWSQETEKDSQNDWLNDDDDYFENMVKKTSKSSSQSQGDRDQSQCDGGQNHYDRNQRHHNRDQSQGDGGHSQTVKISSVASEGSLKRTRSLTPPVGGRDITDVTDAIPIRRESQEAGTSRGSVAARPCPPKKIASVQRDMDTITTILGVTDHNLVYQKLVEKRTDPNRLELVTNEMLEEQSGEPASTTPGVNVTQEEHEMAQFLVDVEKVVSKVKDKLPEKKLDPNEVYMMLETNVAKSNRVYIVYKLLTKSSSGIMAVEPKMELGIIESVELIMKQYPTANADEVYALLEDREKEPDKIENVMKELSQRQYSSKGGASPGNTCKDIKTQKKEPWIRRQNSDLTKDPLYEDMQIVAKIFPDRNQEEIYAYLESFHDKPNRIQLVAKLLLQYQDDQSQDEPPVSPSGGGKRKEKCSPGYDKKSCAEDDSKVVSATNKTAEEPGNNHKETTAQPREEAISPLFQLQKDVDTMRIIFPESDPNFLFEKLEEMSQDPERVNNLSAQMFEHKNYPCLKERLEREKKEKRNRKLLNMELNMEEFLQMFPEPTEHFYDETRRAGGEAYQQHCIKYLLNLFPLLHAVFIQKKFDEHGKHLLPTIRELEEITQNYLTSMYCQFQD